jgi:two-component system NtrC family sensor kinase
LDSNSHLAILQIVASRLSRSLDVEEVLKTALTALTHVTGHEISSLHLLSPSGAALHLRGDRGLTEELREANATLPIGEGAIGRVASTGQTLVVKDAATSPLTLPSARRAVEAAGIRGFVCVPIRAQGRVLGTLSLGRQVPEPFSVEEVRLLEATADQIGVALDNARLYSETRRQLEELKRTQAQLIHAERLAAIGELAAGVAHEINNPLTTILGEIQLLLLEELPARARERLKIVVEEGARTARIVQNLLVFARRYPPQSNPCSLADSVRRVLDLKAYQLQVDDVRVVSDFQTCPPVWADEHQIQQVLLNLVQNAHQAMRPQGGGTLTVRVKPESGWARIEVLDDGPGIAPENLRRLFEPFFTTKAPGEGSGLGLSVSYGIVAEHNGRLWAENRPGGGAAFYVELPFGGPKPALVEAPSDVAPTVRPLRVLVVEDEDRVAHVISNLLRNQGHTVTIALDGADGIARAVASAFDAVIVDVKMPGMNGHEFWQELVSRGLSLARRTVFMSGNQRSPEIAAAVADSGAPTLGKPFTVQELAAVLRVVSQR